MLWRHFHLLLINFLLPSSSTFILAFVKSEGKSVRSNETAPLLEKKEEDELSISGDLRKKLVR